VKGVGTNFFGGRLCMDAVGRPFSTGKEPRFGNRDCNRCGTREAFAGQVAISKSRFLSAFAVPEL